MKYVLAVLVFVLLIWALGRLKQWLLALSERLNKKFAKKLH